MNKPGKHSIGDRVHVPILHGDFIITDVNPLGWQHLDQTVYQGYLVGDESVVHHFVEIQINEVKK
jgi:hypothetical protein